MVALKDKFVKQLQTLKDKGSTSKLWIEYFIMITLIKNFIAAERSGDWDLHLKSVERMIPYFHATGHFLYAKCAHMYLQDMRTLKESMDELEFERFTSEGFFTIRRTDKFWSGIWADMTIEQVLMRSIKTQGGLTHGRGISDSVVAKFILTMIVLIEVCNVMEEFCNVSYAASEQHVDARESRITRDVEDVKKISSFFEIHNPFPDTKHIMSIYSGIIGGNSINCHNAYDIGKKAAESIIGNDFGSVKIQRKKKVVSLKTVGSSIKINGEKIAIDPLLLFQRISLQISTKTDMKDYLKYELSPYPLSLFNENGFKKSVKSDFYADFTSVSDFSNNENVVNVIDGGFLLHKVVWQKNDTVAEIKKKYVNYVINHYAAGSHVLFDGYPNANEYNRVLTPTSATLSTKANERSRRKVSVIPNVNDLQDQIQISFTPTAFLSNENNKNKLIQILCTELRSVGFTCAQAEEDADYLIIDTAIKIASADKTVVVVGQDIDLLVLLTQLNVENKNIFFCKVGTSTIKDAYYSSDSFNHDSLGKYVAFLHSFTGCDTTSGFTGKGKSTLIKSLMSITDLSNLADIFYNKHAEKEVVAKNGIKLIASLYSKKKNHTLHDLRFDMYERASIKSNFKLEKLPPTEGAAREHSFRAYLQLQRWLGNNKNPMDWGWKKTSEGFLMPKYTEEKLIPDILLAKISCSCKKGCNTAKCSCRKHGLKCTNLCLSCFRSDDCSNAEEVVVEHDDIHESEELEEIPHFENEVVEEEDDENEDEEKEDEEEDCDEQVENTQEEDKEEDEGSPFSKKAKLH